MQYLVKIGRTRFHLFSIFKMTAVRQCWIFKFSNLCLSLGLKITNVHRHWHTNFIKSGQTVFMISRCFDFQDGHRLAASTILDFQIFKHLVSRQVGIANIMCTVVPIFSARYRLIYLALRCQVSVYLSVCLPVTFVHCSYRVQGIPDTFACLDRWMSLLTTPYLNRRMRWCRDFWSKRGGVISRYRS